MDLAEISWQIEAELDPDEIRASLAQKVLECLLQRGETLSELERIHFGQAIDLLPSPWLRLTWTHVDAVCNRHDAPSEISSVDTVGTVPDLAQLLSKLEQTIKEIEDHRALAKQSAE